VMVRVMNSPEYKCWEVLKFVAPAEYKKLGERIEKGQEIGKPIHPRLEGYYQSLGEIKNLPAKRMCKKASYRTVAELARLVRDQGHRTSYSAVAVLLGVHRSTVRYWFTKGHLRSYRVEFDTLRCLTEPKADWAA